MLSEDSVNDVFSTVERTNSTATALHITPLANFRLPFPFKALVRICICIRVSNNYLDNIYNTKQLE